MPPIPPYYEAANVYRSVANGDGSALPPRPQLQFSAQFTITDEPETETLPARTRVELAPGAAGSVEPLHDTPARRGPEGELKATTVHTSGLATTEGAPVIEVASLKGELQLGFFGKAATGRPAVNLSSPTLARDVAEALHALGLITVTA